VNARPCYVVHPEVTTLANASSVCKAGESAGTLPFIRSSVEAQAFDYVRCVPTCIHFFKLFMHHDGHLQRCVYLYRLVEGLLITPLWLGAAQVSPSVWHWEDAKSTPLSYTRWAKDEPSPLVGRCVAMGSVTTGDFDRWYSTNCNEVRSFVCIYLPWVPFAV